MGLFTRKKDEKGRSLSVLSENEIKKKLYGEFENADLRPVGSDESPPAKRNIPVTGKTPASNVAPDLFSSAVESPAAPHPDFRQTSRGGQPIEIKPRSAIVPPAASASSRSEPDRMDAYERYREFTRMQPKPSTFSNIFKMFSGFFSGAGSIGRFMTQSVFFWIGGVLAVFILFWGVNALNVQREQAMKTSYQEAPSRTVMKPPVGKEQVSATKRGSREGVSTVPGTETAPAAPAAVPVVSAKTVRPSIATRSFVIQVVTYPSEEYAEKIVTSLKREGFKSFFRESVRPTGATFYVVYVGGFGTAAEAQKQLARFRSSPVSKPFADAFVKTMEIKES